MAKLIRQMLRGASTLVVIYPDPHREITRPLYRGFATPDEAMASVWYQTGGFIAQAMQAEIERVASGGRQQERRLQAR